MNKLLFSVLLFFCAFVFLLTKATQDTKALGGQPSLREHASARNFIIGAGTGACPSGCWYGEEVFTSILAEELNGITPENYLKWNVVHPERYKYNFGTADAQIAFAEANNMEIHGHNLLWHSWNPSWLTDRSWSQTELKQVLEDHIKTVVGRYKGKIKYWDVVNEAYDYNTNLRVNEFFVYRDLGEEAIELAFKWAHEADPDAKLYYNDNGMITSNTRSIDLVNRLNSLRSRGVPIDGVGFQAHLQQNNPPSYYQMKQNLARFTNAGYEVQITELDVAITPSVCGNQAYYDSQAQIYRDILKACLDTPGCKGLTTWGFSDKHSWIKDQCPLPLDQDYQPKPAYFAMYEELGGSYYTPVCTGMSFSVSCAPEGGSYKVYAEGVSSAAYTKFPTWDEEGGQDDIVWYDGVNEGNGRWSVTINQANHPGSRINTDTYLYDYNSEPIFCAGNDIPKCDPKVLLPEGTGTGLRGQYYNNIDFTSLVLTRNDPTINFNWGVNSPDASVGVDTFSVRWEGQIESRVEGSEILTFYTTSDDGIRLWVDNQLIIENWTDHGPTEDVGTITLVGGQKYDVVLEYYENGQGSVIKLEWSSPGRTKEIVPQTQLYFSDPIPNCSNISGPSTLTLGESGTYSADFFSEQGNLGGGIFYNNLNRIEYQDLPGTSGSFSTEWQPPAEGTYNVCCRAWNDAIAECRPPDLVDGPPRYDCQGPNYCMTVSVVKPSLPGDINGDDVVNIQDYILLSNAFGTNDEAADLDGNGIVNIQDFIILSNNFGKTG